MSAVPSPSSPSQPWRALVIDDELSIRRVLRRYLERVGWSVVEASDGAGARRAFAEPDADFDLVICDLNLPDCTGLELRQRLLAQRPGLRGRFIVSTGESVVGSGTLIGREARELSSSGLLLTKPYSLDELGAVVRKVEQAVAA